MKTVGIIGGLGPETTARFYTEVVLLCFEKNKIHRPEIVISSVPLSFELESEFIKSGKRGNEFLGFLLRSAQQLEKADVDFIVIPCNTAHIFIDEIKKSVTIPVLNIVTETSEFLSKQNVKEIGLLATPATFKSKLYDGLGEKGIVIKKPTKNHQQILGRIINRLIIGRNNNQDTADFIRIVKKLSENKTSALLYACTDLQLLEKSIHNQEVFDTMRILAEATVREIISG